MLKGIQRQIEVLRGSLRIGGAQSAASGTPDFHLSDAATGGNEAWLTRMQKLIPGEALAGYISLQPVVAVASDKTSAAIVLALVFLLVTITLRVIGTQDPGAHDPGRTTQVFAVVISAISYVALVYATGGQVWWHAPSPDQRLYGQIASVALGILGPSLYGAITK